MNILLHNSNCSKSNAALAWLQDQNISFESRNYIYEPLHKEELKKLLIALKVPAIVLVRTNEFVWKNCTLNENSPDDTILDFITKNPSVLQRPIFISNNKAIIARPLENLITFINELKIKE